MIVRVYVAGPMKSGLEVGIHRAVQAADELMAEGFIPFLPQLQALWNMISPKDDIYGYFLPFDYAWIDVCDCLLRLSGDSFGADQEVVYAQKIGKPVFYSIPELRKWKESR
jgi:hypothetical protein